VDVDAARLHGSSRALSRASGVTTNDHTVPQSYLRRFAEERRGRGHFIVATEADHPERSFEMNVRNIAAVKGFYWACLEDGTSSHDAEHLFSRIEAVTAPAFAAMLDDHDYALSQRWPLPRHLRERDNAGLDLQPPIQDVAEPGRGRGDVPTLIDLSHQPGHDPLGLALGAPDGALEIALLAGLVTADEHPDPPARRTSLLEIALHRNLLESVPVGRLRMAKRWPASVPASLRSPRSAT
jgi:hypothetical protein